MSKSGIVTRGQAFGPGSAWVRRRRLNTRAPNRGGLLVRNWVNFGQSSKPTSLASQTSANVWAGWFWFTTVASSPLLLRLPRFKERSPLAFPSGRAPGFNPSHPMSHSLSQFAGFSAVFPGTNNMIDLLSGVVTTQTGSPVFKLRAFGPSGQVANGFNWYNFATTHSQTNTFAHSYGIIYEVSSSDLDAGGHRLIGPNALTELKIGSNKWSLNIFGDNSPAGVPSPTANHVYFVGASCPASASNPMLFAITDLTTGQIWTGSVVASFTDSASTATWDGTTQIGTTASGFIYAAAFNFKYPLNQQELRAWAQEPWAFWYPRRRTTFAGVGGVTAFLMAVASGNYNLTDEQQRLLKTSLDSIQSGTYALTVESITALKKSIDTLQSATYAFTPQQFKALKTSLDAVQAGTYALTGENETLLKKSLLNIQETPYTLTGEQVRELKTSLVNAQSGSYVLTDEQLQLLKASTGKVQAGFYNLTDEQLTLLRKADLTTQAGFYALTGEQQRILRTALNNAQAGFYNVAGESLTLTFVAPSVSVALTTAFLFGMGPFAGDAFAQPPFAVTSSPVTAFTLLLGSGFYSLTDETLTLLKASKDGIQSGTYSLTGEQLKTLKGSLLKDTTGTYTLTDESLTLTAARSSKPQAGFYSLTGENETLTATRRTKAQAGFYNLTGENVSLSGGRRGNLQSGFYTETGSNAVLKKTSLLNAQMTPFTFSGESLGLVFNGPAVSAAITTAFLLGMGPFAGNAFAQPPLGLVNAVVTSFTLNIGSGTYTINVENEALIAARREALQTGFYVLSGGALIIQTAFPGQFSISIGTGTYALTDETLTLVKTSKAGLQAATYSLTGEQLALLKGSRLSDTTGTYTLTGEQLKLTVGHLVSPQTGFYAFTSALTVRRKSLLNTAAGFYTVSRNGLNFLFAAQSLVSSPSLFGIDVGVSLSGTKGVGSLLGSRNSGINLTGGESANTLLGTEVVPGIKGGV